MSSSGKSQTVTQNSSPPKYLIPYERANANQAYNIYQQGAPDYYPGQTNVGFSPQTEQALQMQQDRATAGSPVTSAADQTAASTLNGDYLYGGPGFNQAVDAATRYTIPQVQSQFTMAGRGGSGLASTAQTQAIADAFANQYSNQQANQFKYASIAPMLAQNDYNDISQLGNVGTAVQGQAQSQLTDQVNRFNYYQNLPSQWLGQYSGMLQGAYPGSQQTTQTPLYSNPYLGAAGGALTGYGIGSSGGAAAGAASGASEGSSGGWWGAGIGALLGAMASR